MRTPRIRCTVNAHCTVGLSEDPGKITKAITNILPDSDIQIKSGSARASAGPESLERIYETMRSRRTKRAYLKHLKKNLDGDTTWFYLNKQAAFAGNVALCAEADESPLGPIKISLQSSDIEGLISWLAG